MSLLSRNFENFNFFMQLPNRVYHSTVGNAKLLTTNINVAFFQTLIDDWIWYLTLTLLFFIVIGINKDEDIFEGANFKIQIENLEMFNIIWVP